MKCVKITRWAYFPWATVGEILVEDFRGAVLELPWRENERNLSCIPAGTYRMRLGSFKGRYANYELQDVPGRSAIELHRGNVLEDTNGCPLIGTSLVIVTHSRSVYLSESTAAFLDFMTAMGGVSEATLVILENVVSTDREAKKGS